MFDSKLRPLIDPPLNALGKVIAKYNITANQITLLSLFFGCIAGGFLVQQEYLWACFFILLNRFLDGLDGAVARASQVSDFGGYLDIVCDFIFYSGIIFCFVLGDPEFALYGAFLIFSFVGSGVSFLTHAIFATKRGIETEAQGKKSLYYVAGIAEGGETILFFVLICLFPQIFDKMALVFGGICWLTTMARILIASRTFQNV